MLPFEVVEAKIGVPVPRPGSIWRAALVNRLRAACTLPVVTIAAPAGYGKTTVLAQWAERDERSFAWISLDERDNDAVVMLRHVAAALQRIEPLDPHVLAGLRTPGPSIWTRVVPRLGRALANMPRPVVVVVDNAHVLRGEDSIAAVRALCEHVGEGSQVVLAGRVVPPVPIGVLRAEGRLLELGMDSLAFTRREARLLLGASGVGLAEPELADLVERTEGWAAGLYLATLSLCDGGSQHENVGTFGGDDRYLADYFRSECLSSLTARRLRFMRRTAVLDRMCGALCDTVLRRSGSALELEKIQRESLFLVPLDRHGEWYRYHRLFRDLLRRELDTREPGAAAELSRRSADWFESRGELDAAVASACDAGDEDRLARLVVSLALTRSAGDRDAVSEDWLGRFDDQARLRRHPAVAAVGALVHVQRGRAADAERWLALAERGKVDGPLPDGSRSLRPWVAVVRAAMCRDGVEQMLRDTERALAELAAESRWRPLALLLRGGATTLLGEQEQGDAIFADAATAAESVELTDVQVGALAQRALIAFGCGDHDRADVLAAEARGLVEAHGLRASSWAAVAAAAAARLLLRRGRFDDARAELRAARSGTSLLGAAQPWPAVQVRLELGRAYLALRDTGAARTMVAEALEIRRLRPDLGALSERLDELRHELATMTVERPHGGSSGLTGAELRLLPLLATHRSFRAIAEHLYVSRNTVKTQAISIYRKLGVSSRGEAIDRAAHLGLLPEPSDAGVILETGRDDVSGPLASLR